MPDDNISNEARQPFRLLDLPPELWSRICKLAVKQPEPIEVTRVCAPDQWHITPPAWLPQQQWQWRGYRQPPITRVCRLVRNECLPHFYKDNFFYCCSCIMSDMREMKKWAKAIGDTNRDLLGQVYLWRGSEIDREHWRMVSEKNLQDLGMRQRALEGKERIAVEEIRRLYFPRVVKDDDVVVLHWQQPSNEGAECGR